MIDYTNDQLYKLAQEDRAVLSNLWALAELKGVIEIGTPDEAAKVRLPSHKHMMVEAHVFLAFTVLAHYLPYPIVFLGAFLGVLIHPVGFLAIPAAFVLRSLARNLAKEGQRRLMFFNFLIDQANRSRDVMKRLWAGVPGDHDCRKCILQKSCLSKEHHVLRTG